MGVVISMREPALDAPVLQGEVDNVSPWRVRGWARDPARPEEPLSLLVTLNGETIARFVADLPRPDLEAAGFGTGRHGFDVSLPVRLDPACRNVLRVIRDSDGTDLYRSPVVLEADEAFGPVLRQRLLAVLAAPAQAPKLREWIEFLSHELDGLRHRLAAEGEQPGDRPTTTASRRKRRAKPMRALVIDDQLPAPSRDAGSVAIVSHMRSLQRLGYRVDLVPSDLSGHRSSEAEALAAAGIGLALRPHWNGVEEVLRRQAGAFDLVYIHRFQNAARYAALVQAFQPGARLIYSVADLHHLRMRRYGEHRGLPEVHTEAALTRLREFEAAWSASVVITHSTHEADVLRRALPRTPVAVVPWSVRPRPVRRPFRQRCDVAFVAGYRHAPNLDAARWLVHEIMPHVWREAPHIACHLIGSDMPEELRTLSIRGVKVIGHCPDLSLALNRLRLTVAPLVWGAGVKGKVLESLSHGLPCVMTEVAAEGIALPPGLDACRADDAKSIARTIVRLHEDEALNERCAAAGLAYVRETLSERALDRALLAAIEGSGPERARLMGMSPRLVALPCPPSAPGARPSVSSPTPQP